MSHDIDNSISFGFVIPDEKTPLPRRWYRQSLQNFQYRTFEKVSQVHFKCPKCGNLDSWDFYSLVDHYAKCDGVDWGTVQRIKMELARQRMKEFWKCGLLPYLDGFTGSDEAYNRAKQRGLL